MRPPAALAASMRDLHGEAGLQWLARLPETVAAWERRWALCAGPPFPATYHYVAPAVRADGTPAVLKLGLPGDAELRREGAALAHLAGRGAVRLLAAEVGEGALLLARADPGTPLAALVRPCSDERATEIAGSVMQALWRAPPAAGDFPSVADWGAGFARHRAAHGGGAGPLPADALERAEREFARLSASMAEPVLLHGDLHHGNVLRDAGGWLAIDPKGVVGEPAYEPGALLRNPEPALLELPRPGRVLGRRIDQLAEQLALDRERLRGWAFAQAMLSAVWSVEDHGRGWEHASACAALIA